MGSMFHSTSLKSRRAPFLRSAARSGPFDARRGVVRSPSVFRTLIASRLLKVVVGLVFAGYSTLIVGLHQRSFKEGLFAWRNSTDLSEASAANKKSFQLCRSRRFPTYGTEEFSQLCGWTLHPPTAQAKSQACTFLVRPRPMDNEGISKWSSWIAAGFILARETGCRLLLDYGPHVEILQVLMPLLPRLVESDGAHHAINNNWTVPSGFQCLSSNRCVELGGSNLGQKSPLPNSTLAMIGSTIGMNQTPASVPFYREKFHRSSFYDLKRALPGFRLETGMACSLGSLFRLALTASKFEPQIFETILPALNDEKALVMAMYIRTGQTEKKRDDNAAVDEEQMESIRRSAEPLLKCALEVEEKYLSGIEAPLETFSRVVWLLVTDSPELKQWIAKRYDGQAVNVEVPTADTQKHQSARDVQRKVLTTRSHGVHSKPRENPSTADFADAAIDWYLIGESDLVLKSSGYSFGLTGALRTARPIYEAGVDCTRSWGVVSRVDGR